MSCTLVNVFNLINKLFYLYQVKYFKWKKNLFRGTEVPKLCTYIWNGKQENKIKNIVFVKQTLGVKNLGYADNSSFNSFLMKTKLMFLSV